MTKKIADLSPIVARDADYTLVLDAEWRPLLHLLINVAVEAKRLTSTGVGGTARLSSLLDRAFDARELGDLRALVDVSSLSTHHATLVGDVAQLSVDGLHAARVAQRVAIALRMSGAVDLKRRQEHEALRQALARAIGVEASTMPMGQLIEHVGDRKFDRASEDVLWLTATGERLGGVDVQRRTVVVPGAEHHWQLLYHDSTVSKCSKCDLQRRRAGDGWQHRRTTGVMWASDEPPACGGEASLGALAGAWPKPWRARVRANKNERDAYRLEGWGDTHAEAVADLRAQVDAVDARPDDAAARVVTAIVAAIQGKAKLRGFTVAHNVATVDLAARGSRGEVVVQVYVSLNTPDDQIAAQVADVLKVRLKVEG